MMTEAEYELQRARDHGAQLESQLEEARNYIADHIGPARYLPPLWRRVVEAAGLETRWMTGELFGSGRETVVTIVLDALRSLRVRADQDWARARDLEAKVNLLERKLGDALDRAADRAAEETA